MLWISEGLRTGIDFIRRYQRLENAGGHCYTARPTRRHMGQVPLNLNGGLKMTPEERQKRIDELFLQSIEHSPPNQAVFLDNACADDRSLRSEVEEHGVEASRSVRTTCDRGSPSHQSEHPFLDWLPGREQTDAG